MRYDLELRLFNRDSAPSVNLSRDYITATKEARPIHPLRYFSKVLRFITGSAALLCYQWDVFHTAGERRREERRHVSVRITIGSGNHDSQSLVVCWVRW